MNSEAFYEEVFLGSAAQELAASTPPSPFDPPEQRYARALSQVKESFNSWKEDMAHAGQLLDEASFKCANLENHTSSSNELPESIKTCYDLLVATPQDFLNLTPEEFEQIYSIACDHFEENDFIGARDLFLLMTTLNPRTSPPWLGLGLAERRLDHHEEALAAFSQALDLDSTDLNLYLLIVQSLNHAGYTSEALELLNELISLSKDSPEWEILNNSTYFLKEEFFGGSQNE